MVLVTTGQKDVSISLGEMLAIFRDKTRVNISGTPTTRLRRFCVIPSSSITNTIHFTDYTEGAELVDSVLDVVRKEAEGTDCLQGT